VPNISHVFRQDQHLYLLYEIYNPAREKAAENAPKGTKPGINLLSSLELIQGSTKVYETPLVQAKPSTWRAATRWRLSWMCRWPGLKPGQYLCQLNVIDDAAAASRFRGLPCWCGRHNWNRIRISGIQVGPNLPHSVVVQTGLLLERFYTTPDSGLTIGVGS
jgi:hypothetical protein